MEPINDLQVELTKVVILKNNLLNTSERYNFKKIVFIAYIESIEEYAYFFDGKYRTCSAVTLKDGEWFKVKDKYEELKSLHIEFFKKAVESANDGLDLLEEDSEKA